MQEVIPDADDLTDRELEFLELYRQRMVKHRKVGDHIMADAFCVSAAEAGAARAGITRKLGASTIWRAVQTFYGPGWRGAPIASSWRRDPAWLAKLAEYDGACAYCGARDVELVRDHVVPTSAGGSRDWSNVVPACHRCNSVKRDWPVEEFRRRLASREWQAMRMLRSGVAFEEVVRRLS